MGIRGDVLINSQQTPFLGTAITFRDWTVGDRSGVSKEYHEAGDEVSDIRNAIEQAKSLSKKYPGSTPAVLTTFPSAARMAGLKHVSESGQLSGYLKNVRPPVKVIPVEIFVVSR